jgi:hypothetical protein
MIREIKLSGIDENFVHFQWLNRFHFLCVISLNEWADFDACCCIESAPNGCHFYEKRKKERVESAGPAWCWKMAAVPGSAGGKNLARVGEQAFQKMDKINAEVFTLTYGSMVQILLKDYEDVNEVNTQLEKM